MASESEDATGASAGLVKRPSPKDLGTRWDAFGNGPGLSQERCAVGDRMALATHTSLENATAATAWKSSGLVPSAVRASGRPKMPSVERLRMVQQSRSSDGPMKSSTRTSTVRMVAGGASPSKSGVRSCHVAT